MNLYLISRTNTCGYDTYDSAVVCAKDEDEARNMHPGTGQPVDWASSSKYYFSYWVDQLDLVSVELLGSALPSRIEAGVICASYNAG